MGVRTWFELGGAGRWHLSLMVRLDGGPWRIGGTGRRWGWHEYPPLRGAELCRRRALCLGPLCLGLVTRAAAASLQVQPEAAGG